jgi:levanbiose-producing levanase
MRGMKSGSLGPGETLSRRSLLTASAVGAAGVLLPDLMTISSTPDRDRR